MSKINVFTRVQGLMIGLIIILAFFYGGIELESMDFWSSLKPWRSYCLVFGALCTSMIAWASCMQTLMHKGYVNLLWLGLPVFVLFLIEALFHDGVFRSMSVASILMMVFGLIWLQITRAKRT